LRFRLVTCGVRCGHVSFAGADVATAAALAFHLPSAASWETCAGRLPRPGLLVCPALVSFIFLTDILVLTDILPGRRGSDIVLVHSFHHIGYPRYCRDVLESITFLNCRKGPHRSATCVCCVQKDYNKYEDEFLTKEIFASLYKDDKNSLD
jgi:hypothetical protein